MLHTIFKDLPRDALLELMYNAVKEYLDAVDNNKYDGELARRAKRKQLEVLIQAISETDNKS